MKAALVVILWLVTIWRLRSVRQAPWKRSLWLAFFGLSVALTATLPPVTRAIDRASGIVDLATLVKHLAGIVACAAVLDWVLALNKPQNLGRFPARRHYVAATTMVAMVALFFAIDRQETFNFAELESGNGAAATAYLLTFEIYLGIAMGIASNLFSHASRRKATGLLRVGMWILAAGTALGVVYAVLRSAYLIVRFTGNHVPFGDHTMVSTSDAVQALAILLILIGTSIPAVSAGLKAAANYRALHRLRPLWKDLTGQAPTIVLGTPPTRAQDWLAFRGVRQRLLRRTIEIRDAALLLRGLVDHAEQEAIRKQLVGCGLYGERLEAGCEAAWIRSAVAAKKQQRTIAAHSAELRPHGSTALEDEVRWLLLVASFYRAPETAPSTTIPALAMESR
jgi:hypothetical protein